MEKLFIIKAGGAVIEQDEKLFNFLNQFREIEGRKILVHGGGVLATELAEKLGIEQVMKDGRRITTAATLRIVTMVYAGLVNKNIVAKLQSLQCNALGLSGADANLLPAKMRERGETDFGFAGDVASDLIPTKNWRKLIEDGFIPVVCPITHNGEGQLLNTNADTIARELAVALSRYYDIRLIYCFEMNGVMKEMGNPESVLKSINRKEFTKLCESGIVSNGMIPKLDNAFYALDAGVNEVIIGNAASLQALATGNAGTIVTHE